MNMEKVVKGIISDARCVVFDREFCQAINQGNDKHPEWFNE